MSKESSKFLCETRVGELAGPSFVLRAENIVRTPDEDGGLMVQRTPALASTSLTKVITCQELDGDDW